MNKIGSKGRQKAIAVAFGLAFAMSLGAAPAASPAASSTDASLSETRVALVVGNGAYSNVPLKNPVNDARDLATALKGLGFSVTLLVDGDMPAMSRAIRDFGNAIKRPDAVALFYYSGHGIQYKGVNYLIPAKADIQDPDELSFAALSADQVYAKMESSGDRTNIVILDACRNNPFPGAERALERGLAVVGSAPPQSLIVYATAPGKTAQDGDGRNGVFTSALLKHLAEPGLDAELMMRRVRNDVLAATGGAQVPWANSSVTGSGFSFAGGGRLLVSTEPSGAEIFVDGQRRGVSPLSLADLPRFSEIEVSAKSGSKTAAKRLTITDAAQAKLQLSLQAARGSILVAANEKVLKALVDGAEVAIGPNGAIEGVEAGTHGLELQGDSSGFKAQVEVDANAVAKVSATLVPSGSLTIGLPEGTTCRIEGMGIAETTSRYNYGPLPAGSYKLTVSGGDYESYSETVSVERGKRLEFAPKLRNTADYLVAKYRIEVGRLQAVVAGGASSQADVEDAGVLAKKIKAEGRPELADLAAKADALGATLVSLRPAASPAGAQAVANSGKSTGTLTLTSDPPGMLVSIDGGDTVETPVSLELGPGAHSFEPKESSIKSIWYAAQSLQWIMIAAGSETRVPVRLKQETALLTTKLVPEGFKVFVNGQEMGETPLNPIEVPAGLLMVRFEKEGEEPRSITLAARPGDAATASWGKTQSMAITLRRQTIKLDATLDSWEGIDPVYEVAQGSFMGSQTSAIRRFYVCRDDKYLYWRADFFELNPFWKTPAGVKDALCFNLFVVLVNQNKNLCMSVNFVRAKNGLESNVGIWDVALGKMSDRTDNAVSSKQSKTTFVARTEIAKVIKYCKGPLQLNFDLTTVDGNWRVENRSADQLSWVDFSK